LLGYDLGKASVTCSGSHSDKVPGGDSAKESGTISGKNLGKRPYKKSGKELPDQVKTQVRRSGKTKMCKTWRLLGFR
jgi:hypothetical protein